MQDLSKLLTLKDQIINATDLSGPWDYFLTHFGENPTFMSIGKPAFVEHIQVLLAIMSQSMLKRPAKEVRQALLEIKPYQFFHGICTMDQSFASIIYFRDIDMGILNMVNEHTLQFTMVRFSCTRLAQQPSKAMH